MNFKEGINIGVSLIGVFVILIGFIKQEYQTQALVFGILAIIVFVILTPLITKVHIIEEKNDLLYKEISKLNEKLKIYEYLANLDIRIKNLENRKK